VPSILGHYSHAPNANIPTFPRTVARANNTQTQLQLQQQQQQQQHQQLEQLQQQLLNHMTNDSDTATFYNQRLVGAPVYTAYTAEGTHCADARTAQPWRRQGQCVDAPDRLPNCTSSER